MLTFESWQDFLVWLIVSMSMIVAWEAFKFFIDLFFCRSKRDNKNLKIKESFNTTINSTCFLKLIDDDVIDCIEIYPEVWKSNVKFHNKNIMFSKLRITSTESGHILSIDIPFFNSKLLKIDANQQPPKQNLVE